MNINPTVSVPLADLKALLNGIQLLGIDYDMTDGENYNDNQRLALMTMLTSGSKIMRFVMHDIDNPNFESEINRLFGIE